MKPRTRKSFIKMNLKNPLLVFLNFLILNIGYAQVTLESSNLPIVIINTNGQSITVDEKVINLKVIYNGEGKRNFINSTEAHYNGKAEINIRGNSSTMFPKKAFSLKTIDHLGVDFNFPLLGLPTEHSWVLHAAYNDKTLMRNYISYRLSAEMGNYAPRTKFIEVVINGDYRGVYLLVESIKRDKNRVNISKNLPETIIGDGLTGGYIVKIDKMDEGEAFWTSNYASNTSGDRVKFLYHYPKEIDINEQQKYYIENHFHDFEDALQSGDFMDKENGYRKFINVKSFIDHLILNEASRDVDGYRVSTYLYKDKDSKDGRIHIGPVWDYDLAWFNANYGGGNKTEGWQYKYNYYWTSSNPDKWPSPFWWRRFLEDPDFVIDWHCRYTFLRQSNGVLDLKRISNMIDSVASALSESSERNFKRWPVLGEYVWPNPEPFPETYEGELDKLKSWINDRLLWLDNNTPGSCPKDYYASVKEDVLASLSLKVYPNPFRGEMNVNFLLHEPADVQIEVLNSYGMVVKSFPKAHKTTGVHFEQFNSDELSAGVYILVLKVNGKSYHQKLIKV
ncbi:MAG: CotH kinase family protein [Bacteroidetes bacterium]|nr:CotH kinase family protein [Bacteroidota bacterium]